MKRKPLLGLSSFLATLILMAVSYPVRAATAVLQIASGQSAIDDICQVRLTDSSSCWTKVVYHLTLGPNTPQSITHTVDFCGVGTYDDPTIAEFANLAPGTYDNWAVASGTSSQGNWNASTGDNYITMPGGP